MMSEPLQDEIDLAAMQPPVELAMTGLKQLLDVFRGATVDIQHMLTYDCDVIMECKCCRSLYRGLPNFITHRRLFCHSEKTNKTPEEEESLENCQRVLTGRKKGRRAKIELKRKIANTEHVLAVNTDENSKNNASETGADSPESQTSNSAASKGDSDMMPAEENAGGTQTRSSTRVCASSQRSSTRRHVNLESGITSTFSLEDYLCPHCTYSSPTLCTVVKHLIAKHHYDKDKSVYYRIKLKEMNEKRRDQMIQNLSSSRGSVVRTRQEQPESTHKGGFLCPMCPKTWPKVDDVISHLIDGHDMNNEKANSYKSDIVDSEECLDSNLDDPDHRRKQKDPAKCLVSEEKVSAKNISVGSGFSLWQCLNCDKVCGSEAAMTAHLNLCRVERNVTPDCVSEAGSTIESLDEVSSEACLTDISTRQCESPSNEEIPCDTSSTMDKIPSPDHNSNLEEIHVMTKVPVIIENDISGQEDNAPVLDMIKTESHAEKQSGITSKLLEERAEEITSNVENLNGNDASLSDNDVGCIDDTDPISSSNREDNSLDLESVRKRKRDESHSESASKKSREESRHEDNVEYNMLLAPSGNFSLQVISSENHPEEDTSKHCLACSLKFENQSSFQDHMMKKHVNKVICTKCNECGALFADKNVFQRHLQDAHGLAGDGPRSYVTKYVLDSQIMTSLAGVSKHDQTDPAFNMQRDLTEHIISCLDFVDINYARPKTEIFRCLKHPSLSFMLFSSFEEHLVNEHFRPSIDCPYCTFSSAFSELVQHLQNQHDLNHSNIKNIQDKLKMAILIDDDCCPDSFVKEAISVQEIPHVESSSETSSVQGIAIKTEPISEHCDICEETSIETSVNCTEHKNMIPKEELMEDAQDRTSCNIKDESLMAQHNERTEDEPKEVENSPVSLMSDSMISSEGDSTKSNSPTEKENHENFKSTRNSRSHRLSRHRVNNVWSLVGYFCPHSCSFHSWVYSSIVTHLQTVHGYSNARIESFQKRLETLEEKGDIYKHAKRTPSIKFLRKNQTKTDHTCSKCKKSFRLKSGLLSHKKICMKLAGATKTPAQSSRQTESEEHGPLQGHVPEDKDESSVQGPTWKKSKNKTTLFHKRRKYCKNCNKYIEPLKFTMHVNECSSSLRSDISKQKNYRTELLTNSTITENKNAQKSVLTHPINDIKPDENDHEHSENYRKSSSDPESTHSDKELLGNATEATSSWREPSDPETTQNVRHSSKCDLNFSVHSLGSETEHSGFGNETVIEHIPDCHLEVKDTSQKRSNYKFKKVKPISSSITNKSGFCTSCNKVVHGYKYHKIVCTTKKSKNVIPRQKESTKTHQQVTKVETPTQSSGTETDLETRMYENKVLSASAGMSDQQLEKDIPVTQTVSQKKSKRKSRSSLTMKTDKWRFCKNCNQGVYKYNSHKKVCPFRVSKKDSSASTTSLTRSSPDEATPTYRSRSRGIVGIYSKLQIKGLQESDDQPITEQNPPPSKKSYSVLKCLECSAEVLDLLSMTRHLQEQHNWSHQKISGNLDKVTQNITVKKSK